LSLLDTAKGAKEMKINLTSNYLKSADLQGRSPTVIMDHVKEVDFGEDGTKNVLFFKGKDKGLVLNITNTKAIMEHYGDETDHWQGRSVTLYVAKVQYKDKMVDAIRIDVPVPAPRKPAAQYTEVNPPPQTVADDMDDEIPF
jgi:hypothetical protein